MKNIMLTRYGWKDGLLIEACWKLAEITGWLWERGARGRASYWLDWLPTWGISCYYWALNRAMTHQTQHGKK